MLTRGITAFALAQFVTGSVNSTLGKVFQNRNTWGGEAGGDVQGQYTQQYAGNYTKYMSTGDQSKGGNVPAFATTYVGKGFEKYVNAPKDTTLFQQGSISSQTSQGGDYQQYMKQYAGDYQKYMSQGKQGQQGTHGSQGGAYQQYMKQYAADYQKYMSQGQKGKQGQQGGQASGGGDYQQYLSLYAGDYQKYTSQGQQGGQSSQGGDYQQYMKQYAADYQKYMSQGQKGKQGQQGGQASGSGNYQQYLSMYAADYQKYMSQGKQGQPGGQSGQTGGSQQYMKDYAQYYEKYMKQGNMSNATDFKDQYAGDYIPHVRNASDSEEWAAAYQKKYAGEYTDGQNESDSKEWAAAYQKEYTGEYTDVHNESDSKEWAAAYQKKYAGGYMAKYAADEKDANASTNGKAVKMNAKECRTLAELDAWREAQLAKANFVPGAYRAFARDSIQREYDVNSDRIIKEQREATTETAVDEKSSKETLTHSHRSAVQRVEATPTQTAVDEKSSKETLADSNPSVAQRAEATPTAEAESGASSVVTKPHGATHNGTAPVDDAITLADNSEMHGHVMRPILVFALFAAVVSALAAGVVKRNRVVRMPAGYLHLVEEP